ncbi:MAG: membrane integrity-associated transporter subunit PqiC [Legionellaceae bacterium]|nr:membrane integrity-associated transporter subunit PqiC [Legionellaceae bacterium]
MKKLLLCLAGKPTIWTCPGYLVLLSLVLCGCTPVKSPVSHQYKLTAFSGRQLAKHPGHQTLLVSPPQAVAGYQGTQMLYVDQNYALASFAHNAWVDSPGNMMFPLMLQSLQQANYFRAVASSPYSEKTDYRLDTQILEWQQNFLKHPSVIQVSIKAVLSDISNSRVLGSEIFRQQVKCPQNNPYGGVIASNIAAAQLTAAITRFAISKVEKRPITGK